MSDQLIHIAVEFTEHVVSLCFSAEIIRQSSGLFLNGIVINIKEEEQRLLKCL